MTYIYIYIYIERERERECFYANLTTRSKEEEIYRIFQRLTFAKGGINMKELFEEDIVQS
jgi:hypothetical protein